jgi:hypothetical protein
MERISINYLDRNIFFYMLFLLIIEFSFCQTSCTSTNDFYINYKEQNIYSRGGTLKFTSIVSADQSISESLNIHGESDHVHIINLKPYNIYGISNMGGDNGTIIRCYETDSIGKIYKEIDQNELPDSLMPIESWAIAESNSYGKHLEAERRY